MTWNAIYGICHKRPDQYGDIDEEIREFKETTGIDVLKCASVDNREDLDGLAALIEV